jgi:RNA polymerase-binding transcription factor DksA
MLNKDQVARLERRLLEERDRTVRILRQLGSEIVNESMSDGDLSAMPTHMADQASDLQEEQVDVALANQHGERLAAIDDALRRLREAPQDFDVSEVSGARIPFERLELLPWVRLLTSEEEAREQM